MNKNYSLGQVIDFRFVVHDPFDNSTPAFADENPTFRIYKGTEGVTVAEGECSQIDDIETIGQYLITLELLEENGFEDGEEYSIFANIVVSGIAASLIVGSFRIGSLSVDEIKDIFSGKVGASNVTLRTIDSASAPVPYVFLVVKNSDESATLVFGNTDQNGYLEIGLDDGEYVVVVRSATHFGPSGPYSFTVEGTTSFNVLINAIEEIPEETGISVDYFVDKIRAYIDDLGEYVSRNLIGAADGNRRLFLLRHHNIDLQTLIITVNGEQTTNYVIADNKIHFDSAPTINSAMIADYLFYEYSTEILRQAVTRAVGYLDRAINLGWGNAVNNVWEKTLTYDIEDLILTAAILEFLQMQITRLPVAISFGDIGARVSLRGAGMERQRAIQEIKNVLYEKIDQYRDHIIIFGVVD